MLRRSLVQSSLLNNGLKTAVIFILLCANLACAPEIEPNSSGAADAEERLRVLVSIRPLALIIQDLTGDAVVIDTLIQANVDPHNVSLRFSDRKKLANADLLVWLGPEFERFLAKAAAQRDGLNNLQLGEIDGMSWPNVDSRDQDHNHDHDGHDNHGRDMHLWLNPENAEVIVRAVAAQLSLMKPSLAPILAKRLSEVVAQYRALEEDLVVQLKPLRGLGLAVYHDAYGHFMSQFKLHQVAAVNEMPEQQLSAKRMHELQTQMAQAHCLLLERDSEPARRLAARLNIPVVLANPLASNGSYTGYAAFLRDLSTAIMTCAKAA